MKVIVHAETTIHQDFAREDGTIDPKGGKKWEVRPTGANADYVLTEVSVNLPGRERMWLEVPLAWVTPVDADTEYVGGLGDVPRGTAEERLHDAYCTCGHAARADHGEDGCNRCRCDVDHRGGDWLTDVSNKLDDVLLSHGHDVGALCRDEVVAYVLRRFQTRGIPTNVSVDPDAPALGEHAYLPEHFGVAQNTIDEEAR